MAMGNSLFPAVINIFTEYLEEIALETAVHILAKCLRYIKDTSMILATWASKIAATSPPPIALDLL
jgi:hypothetical protein